MRRAHQPNEGHWENRLKEWGNKRGLGATQMGKVSGLGLNIIRGIWYNPERIPEQAHIVEALSQSLDIDPMDLIIWVPSKK